MAWKGKGVAYKGRDVWQKGRGKERAWHTSVGMYGRKGVARKGRGTQV